MEPTKHELSRQFDAQKKFFASGATRPLAGRRESLRALAAEVEGRSDDLLSALASDLGKPPLESWLAEIYMVLSEARLIQRKLPRWARPVRTSQPFFFLPARSEFRREPQGCVLIAGTWNYPVQLCLSPLMAAVAGGNCVILKPSEHAPATSHLLADLIRNAFAPEHVTVVEGGAETGAALLDLPFDHFFCTGGENVGRHFADAAARHLAPATLELGGKCPCVVGDDIPLERAVERITWGKFFNAGQTCVAPDFVLVPEHKHDEFTNLAKDQLTSFYGEKASENLARIVNEDHFNRLRELIPPGVIQIGDDDPARLRMAPRLIPNAGWDSPAMTEEVFGPILPIVGYSSLDEALQRLRTLPAPLALYCFSHDEETRRLLTSALRSGAVCFNDVARPTQNPHLPFGGVGASGHGRYHGRAGFENFTYARAYVRRRLWPDPFFVAPPYQGKLRLLRKFLR